MSNNHKGKLKAVQAQPTTVAARLTITAFTDRPPALECTDNLIGVLRLLVAGLAIVSNAVERAIKPPSEARADPVDKKREYLGARE